MRELIGPHQTSFVSNRHITDNVLVYQEVLNSLRTKKKKGGWMIHKVDIDKAYDRLSWDFIQSTLHLAEFNTVWIRNIMNCITIARLSVSCNEVVTEWFKHGRGIR